MDNRQFDITDRLDGQALECAVMLAMNGTGGAVAYRNEPIQMTNDNPCKLIRLPRLTIYSHVPRDVEHGTFIARKRSTELAVECRAWLDQLEGEDYGPKPFSSDDGSVGHGFRLWLGMFGRLDPDETGFAPVLFAVEPCWAWYHK